MVRLFHGMIHLFHGMIISLLEVKRLTLRPSSPFWRSNARSLRIPSLTFIVIVRLLSGASKSIRRQLVAGERPDPALALVMKNYSILVYEDILTSVI
jgi:hypothetical protein